jgi:hypothetical protein
MPDLGISKAVRSAVRAASKDAKVVRPGEVLPERGALAGLEGAAVEPPPIKPIDPSELQAPTTPLNVDGINDAPTPFQLEVGKRSEELVAPKDAPTAFQLDVGKRSEELVVPPGEADAQAQKLGGRLADYKLDESFQTNFDTIRTTDDVKATIAEVAQQNAPKIDAARRGTITNEQLRGLAGDLDVDTDVVRKVMERETGGVLNPETILAARQVLNSSADRLTTLAQKITSGQATDLERIQFRRQFQFHSEYQAQFMGARAESGRALNAFNIPVGHDPASLRRVSEVVDTMYGDVDKLAEKISKIDSPSGLAKFARGYGQHKIANTLNELFINSILSGPRTNLVNITGNALMAQMNVAETAMAAQIGRFLGTEERVQVGEASALLGGQIAGVRDGLRLAWRAMKEGRTIEDVSKYEMSPGRAPAISAQTWLDPTKQNTPLGRTIDAIGTVVRIPTERVMAPTDEFFKTVAYRAELERQTMLHVQAQLDSGAITIEQAAATARDFMENTPLTIQQAADDYARYVSFQNELGPTGKKFQSAINSTPLLRLIAPFIRTPTNIFKAGLLDRSPLAFATRKFYNDLAAGGRQRDMALARVSMGTATSAFIAQQVIDGNVSGGGPQDPEARKVLEATGWRPYSIYTPTTGTWHSYARMEPWASVVGATADAVEIASYVNEDPDTLKDESQMVSDNAAAIVAGIANNTMNKTFMKGLADFTETLSDPGRYVQNWGGEMATAMVPYSALRQQLAATQDPYLREAWTINEKLRASSGIPGWSENAPPRRDIWGQPRRRSSGSLLGSMSPIPDSTENNDPMTREIVNLMQETRQVPVTMPGKSVEGMRLNSNEYDKLVQLSRASPIFRGTETFRDQIERVMTSTPYMLATPDYKVELLKSVQNQADGIARAKLEQEDPDFADRIALYRAKKNRLRFGNK